MIRNRSAVILITAILFAACCLPLAAQSKKSFVAEATSNSASSVPAIPAALAAPAAPPQITRPPGTLFVVGYAHLDTQWRWEYPQVIREYLANTLHDNFNLFEKYPHYIFNFSGANRYGMFKEYYPADYTKMKQYIAQGRWFPAGSSMEESDVNSPSAESVFRQVLYGNQFFRREFNKTSAEYMLPDCFGFPASLPSILAASGIKGFSTQKLTWHSSAPAGGPDSPEKTPLGIPFNVGWWEGPDGKGVIAALNPGSYSADITFDLTNSTPPPTIANDENAMREFVDWPARVELDGKVSGLYTDYHYYGTGDIGGSPRESSVKLLEAIVTKSETTLPTPRRRGAGPRENAPASDVTTKVGTGPLNVVSSNAEQMFLAITPAEAAKLPRYKGDMELIEHSAGSLTSEAYHKRWNRKNELLADAAERASFAAEWLGGRPYPMERLNRAWRLVMGGQFHDIQAGTATPASYEFSWNDDILAMNQFAGVLTSATSAIASALNTQTQGTALVVYNPLNIAREDVVEAEIAGAPQSVRVVGPDSKEVPSQVVSGANGRSKVLFVASVPSVGFAVYDVQPGSGSSAASSELKVSESGLENNRYRVQIDQNGDVSSIFDKEVNKELLSAPARLAFQTEAPFDWPAWNMDWTDQQKPPRGFVGGPAKVRVVENGPVRVALEIAREGEGSKFVETVRLSAGDAGNRVEFANAIDWKTEKAALKATFPLSASNPQATYNWDIGTVQRTNNEPKKYEVPSHQWFDLTDKSGGYGVTILSDCKYGSDKPDDNTLRLTLIYTPGLGGGNGREYADQTTQDWGHHEILYGLAGHSGDWRQEQTDWQGYRLNQPLIAFESPKHAGALGKTFSLLRVSNPRVRVLALKKAEDSNETIVRVVEMSGQPAQNVHLVFAAPVTAAREVNGQEQPVGAAQPMNGELVTSLTPYAVRTFAVKLGQSRTRVAAPSSQPVTLQFDRAVATNDGASSNGKGFDTEGRALAAEMLPRQVSFSGVTFNLGPAQQNNAVTTHGQTINLPAGRFNRVYVLAASADGDQRAEFRVGNNPVELNVQDWSGFIGQWDDRTWNKRDEQVERPNGLPPRTRHVLDYTGLKPGYVKTADVAWFSSHRHSASGENEPYSYSYLFAYPIDLPANTTVLTLPNNENIRVLAISVANVGDQVRPAQPLYDQLETKIDPAMYQASGATPQ